MNKDIVVIALGGNALETKGEIPTFQNQLKNVRNAVKEIVKVINAGYQVVITHGNGPQVGRLLLRSEATDSNETPAFSLDVCDAMSQALIGYMIQQSLENELKNQKINKNVISVVTQIKVSNDDDAFKNPSKPIGPFYSKEEAEKKQKEKGYIVKEDSGRGYRRVVPSPKPQEIVELASIQDLINQGNIVICCGGGGIPVVNHENILIGVEAVIDKDLASNLLAKNLNAKKLAILTTVKNVALNFNTPEQEELQTVTTNELKNYIAEDQFAKGSMLPKVQAVIDFTDETGNESVITTLENIYNSLETNKTGTIIKKQ